MAQRLILIIEKDVYLGRTFRLIFESTGYMSTIATNCEEASRCLQQGDYQTLLVNQQSLNGTIAIFLSQLHYLVQGPIQVIWLVSDPDRIPRLPQTKNITVTHLPAPADPEVLLKTISSLHPDGKGPKVPILQTEFGSLN